MWPSMKAKRLLAALKRIGWEVVREEAGSHKTLGRPGWKQVTFAFHDSDEVGSVMVARVAKRTGLKREDL